MSYISHEDYKNLMTKFQTETSKGMLKEALDKPGHEDADIDNDGDTDKTDKYLLKRRQAIGKAIKGSADDKPYNPIAQAHADYSSPADRRYNSDSWVQAQKDMKEYSYTDNYPGSWGYREGLDDSMQSRAYDMAAKLMGMGQGKDEVYQFLVNKQNLEGSVAQSMVDDLFGSDHLEDDDDMWIDPAGGTHYGDEDDPAAMYREGLNPAPMQATGPTTDVTEEKLNVQSPEEVAKFVAAKHPDLGLKMGMDREKTALKHAYDAIVNVSGEVVARNLVNSLSNPDWPSDYLQALKGMLANKEGLKPAPMQATGQSIKEDVAPYGFEVLSPDERKQLKEYIESVKTIKKEIAKLAAKAGKKVRMEGGDMTGLTMGPSVTLEDEGAIKVGDIVIPNLGPHKGQKHVVIAVLPDGSFNIKPQWPGLSASQIKYRQGAAKAKADQIQKVNEDDDAETQHMISKMEKEKEGEEAVKGQYDPH